MTKWIRGNVATLLTAAALLCGLAAGYAKIQTTQAALCRRIEQKTDKEAVYREMDLIQGHLERIEGKLDGLIQSQAD